MFDEIVKLKRNLFLVILSWELSDPSSLISISRSSISVAWRTVWFVFNTSAWPSEAGCAYLHHLLSNDICTKHIWSSRQLHPAQVTRSRLPQLILLDIICTTCHLPRSLHCVIGGPIAVSCTLIRNIITQATGYQDMPCPLCFILGCSV